MLFEHSPQPAAPQIAPPVIAPKRRGRKPRDKRQATFAEFKPEAFKRSLMQKYKEPRSDKRERIATCVLTAAQRFVGKYYRGSRSDRDDVASEVALAALPRAYRWKPGKKSIEQYAFGCCRWAFNDLMKLRNAAAGADALEHTQTGVDACGIHASEISEHDEPDFEEDEE